MKLLRSSIINLLQSPMVQRAGIAASVVLLLLAVLAARMAPVRVADSIWGQSSFLSTDVGNGDQQFNVPSAVAFDQQGNLYVVDTSNHRVLRFPRTNETVATVADRIWGQPDMTTTIAGTNNRSLRYPAGMAFDAGGNLFVADQYNNRVVRFPRRGGDIAAVADRVWGQPTLTMRGKTDTASRLNLPSTLVFDRNDNMFVVDGEDHRVVRFPRINGEVATHADFVLGQPNLSTRAPGTNAHKFFFPKGIVLDEAGNLFVADYANNRVVRFPVVDGTLQEDADQVWGQADMLSNTRGTSDNAFNGPSSVAIDPAGNLLVADQHNNRVVRFPRDANGIAHMPDAVWGQPTLATRAFGTSDRALGYPTTIALDASGHLHVADTGNNRVVRFAASPPVITSQPAGQTILYGARATLAVTATADDGLRYEWYAGPSGDTTTPVGSTATLTVTPTTTTSYWVRVTSDGARVDSAVARVVVSPVRAVYYPATDTFGLENLTPASKFIQYAVDGAVRGMILPARSESFVMRVGSTITISDTGDLIQQVRATTSAIVTPMCMERTATLWARRPGSMRWLVDNRWTFAGTRADDVIVGTTGIDTIDGNEGNDALCGLKGSDTLRGGAGNDVLSGGAEDDTLEGSVGVDRLVGDTGADRIKGGPDNDTLVIDGSDIIDGGLGFDTLTGPYSTTPLVIDLGTARIELAYGSPLGDRFTASSPPDGASGVVVYGRAGDDTIIGSSGDDQLWGEAGDDMLSGAKGNDTLAGGKGRDQFSGGAGNDRILDFNAAENDTRDATIP